MKIGVLALQGAFREHQYALEKCGAETVQVRLPGQLEGLDGLVIPGGESTTMGKLMRRYNLYEPLIALANRGVPFFGTCAGMIMLARNIADSDQPRLGLMDINVERNASGRQVDSFEADLQVPVLGEASYRAVFIRAPYILSVGANVDVLAKFEEKIVMARQGHYLAAAFHPELTEDLRLHRYFVDMVQKVHG